MKLNDYQVAARKFAVYVTPAYPVLGLAEEAGEVAGKFAKAYRKGTDPDREVVLPELGDVLWMLSAVAGDLGYSLEDVAEYNLRKLQDRVDRHVLVGEGDNR